MITRRALPAAALAATLAAVLTACSSTSGSGAVAGSSPRSASVPGGTTVATGAQAAPGPASPTSGSGSPASPTRPGASASRPAEPVHIKLLNSDGSTYGVGMPVVAFFSRRITDAKALQQATTATVDGRPIKVAWYFETSGYYPNYPIEAHLRPATYWPAHAHVHVDIPAKGLPAGRGMIFDDSLTSDWRTGARTISTVDNATHTMTVTSDGRTYGTFPVSLGAADTATFRGVKVIMEQVPTVCMHDTGNHYYECGIKWDQRVTYTGEYLHSAPWNCIGQPGCAGPANNIGRANSSNGCTNLRPADAERLYRFLRVGDVVRYPNADGRQMQLQDGYGDWNIDWSQWLTGGLLSTG
jgi:lipoprotein-anchoring transpeptidase ErfK/SrfK